MATRTIAALSDLNNLTRAYRWVRTGTNVWYKNLFRDSVAAYSIASAAHLKALRSDILNDRYEPQHASKLYLPKASGVLRPITLLEFQDQIVYQAFANLIGDAFRYRQFKKYKTIVYSNTYAGRSSTYFFYKWKDGYKAYTRFALDQVSKGRDWVAEFDLASFFDLIDHKVLAYFLGGLGFDKDLIALLLRCLGVWTSSTWGNMTSAIYHGHGIPQGPIASGIVAELLLDHVDKAGSRGSRVGYARYVDDIKLFALKESDLRRKIISLDLACKEIGLVPQTQKLKIRKVSEASEIIKSVSIPPEPSLVPIRRPDRIVKKLLAMLRGGNITANLATRFRFLLANSTLNLKLTKRLVEVLSAQPEYAPDVARYLTAYKKLPNSISRQILDLIWKNDAYHSVNAELLYATHGKVQGVFQLQYLEYCMRRYASGRRLLPLQVTFKDSLHRWLITSSYFNYTEVCKAIDEETDWWVKKSMVKYIAEDQYGRSSYTELSNKLIRTANAETARVGAEITISNSLGIFKPYDSISSSAQITLNEFHTIHRRKDKGLLVNTVIRYVFGKAMPEVEWSKLLGKKTRQAEQIAIACKQAYESDVDTFIVRLDSLCDLIYESLFQKLEPLKSYGNYGGMISSPSVTIKGSIPYILDGFAKLHAIRLQSLTPHPRQQRSGVGTRRLTYRDFYKIRRSLIAAFLELRAMI